MASRIGADGRVIVAADATRERGNWPWPAGPRRWAEPTDGGGDPDGLTLLPTPAVNDMGAGKTPEAWDEWTAAMRAKHGNGNGHGKSLEIEAQRLLPTPKASDGPNGGPGMRNGRGVADALPGVVGQLLPTPTARDWKDGATDPDAVPVNGLLGRAVWHDFGPYAAAINRWEQVIGRPAPPPTEPGKNGRPRLSPRFVEFLMGLPDRVGHRCGHPPHRAAEGAWQRGRPAAGGSRAVSPVATSRGCGMTVLYMLRCQLCDRTSALDGDA